MSNGQLTLSTEQCSLISDWLWDLDFLAYCNMTKEGEQGLVDLYSTQIYNTTDKEYLNEVREMWIEYLEEIKNNNNDTI